MPIKNNFYAYFLPDGKNGTVDSWEKCKKLVSGVKDARYKGFKNLTDAKKWLSLGAKYEVRIKQKMPKGVYFDAGTGRGEGVEISVTDKNGRDLLEKVLHPELINKHGKHLLPKEKTNNYGELLACRYALEIANLLKEKYVFGDSRLVINYWSKWLVKKEVNAETKKLAREVAGMRKDFENLGGKIKLISGNDNPADLGFHK
ncbi:MAG: ribonuclease H family protein [Parcubacteria group bacterium]